MEKKIQKPYQIVKVEKYFNIYFNILINILIGAKNGWPASAKPIVFRRVLPGRITVVSFWTKYVLFYVKLNPVFSSQVLEKAKETLALPSFF